MNLELILDRLHEFGQRATYAAVGGLVRLPAISVMHGRPKDKRHSWVVAKGNGLPTGYLTDEIDPRLATSPKPIVSADELAAWLRTHG